MSIASDRSAAPEPQLVETRLGPVEVALVGEGADLLRGVRGCG